MTPQEQVENWKTIPGYEGKYEVSDLGKIRSLVYRNTQIRKIPLVLKYHLTSCGYYRLNLPRINSNYTTLVNRIVLMAFVGPAPTREHESAHTDGDRKNNELSNLRWATRKENADDKQVHGTHPKGEKCVFSKLTLEAIQDIRTNYVRYHHSKSNAGELAEKYGVKKHTIQKVINGKSWKK